MVPDFGLVFSVQLETTSDPRVFAKMLPSTLRLAKPAVPSTVVAPLARITLEFELAEDVLCAYRESQTSDALRCPVSTLPLNKGCIWRWENAGTHGVGVCELDWATISVSSKAKEEIPEITPEAWLFRCDSVADARALLRAGRRHGLVSTTPEASLSLENCIGEGKYSTVHLARCVDDGSQEKLAVKKDIMERVTTRSFADEVAMLRRLDHKNVLGFRGVFMGPRHRLLIAMERVNEGNLADVFVSQRGVGKPVKTIARQLMTGLAYLHARHIVHRDLKPDNVLVQKNSSDPSDITLVLADFGLSAFEWDATAMNMWCGTPGFVAPEVALRNSYSTNCDVFSVGCLLYAVLFGGSPFARADAREVLRATARSEVDYANPRWDRVRCPAACVAFIKMCLIKEPVQRPTSEAALQHRYIQEEGKLSERTDSNGSEGSINMRRIRYSDCLTPADIMSGCLQFEGKSETESTCSTMCSGPQHRREGRSVSLL